MTLLLISNIALWVTVLVLAVGMYSMTRFLREFLSRSDVTQGRRTTGLAIDSVAPPLTGTLLNGRAAELGTSRGLPTYLLFVHDGCVICEYLLSQIATRTEQWADLPGQFIIVSEAPVAFFQQWPSLTATTNSIQVLSGSKLHKEYRIPSYPRFVVVNAAGRVARYEAVDTWEAINRGIRVQIPSLDALARS